MFAEEENVIMTRFTLMDVVNVIGFIPLHYTVLTGT